jgi:hypothetical protein
MAMYDEEWLRVSEDRGAEIDRLFHKHSKASERERKALEEWIDALLDERMRAIGLSEAEITEVKARGDADCEPLPQAEIERWFDAGETNFSVRKHHEWQVATLILMNKEAGAS